MKGASSSSNNVGGETQASTVEMLLSNFEYYKGWNLDDEELSFELVDGEVALGDMSFPNDIHLIADQNI